MKQSHIYLLLGIVISLSGCKNQSLNTNSFKAQNLNSSIASKANNGSRNNTRLLKTTQAFISYAQEHYAEEFSLIDSNSISQSEVFAKKIKEMALKKHEKYLKSGSSTFKQVLGIDFTRLTPLFHYQDTLEKDAAKASTLEKQLKKMLNFIIDQEDKKMVELVASINHKLTLIHDIIRYDLDFLRDKQICLTNLH